VQDYKHLQQAAQSQKLGGLGANIGGEDWEKARRAKEVQAELGRQFRLQNLARQAGAKRSKEPVKEKSRREIAMEFARNITKGAKKQVNHLQNGEQSIKSGLIEEEVMEGEGEEEEGEVQDDDDGNAWNFIDRLS
jgi:hypothetical protein